MRLFTLLYGLTAYAGFHAAFLYLIAFVSGLYAPTSVAHGGPESGVLASIAINVALITLFGVQHGIMARPWFKRRWTRIVPKAVERSTFVVATVGVLALMFWQWRPLPTVVWSVEGPASVVLWSLFASGWLIVVLSTFLIDHFELFGLRQSVTAFLGREVQPLKFRERGFYRVVRHPLMLGFLMSFWSVPTMTVGGLVFAGVFTCYVLIALQIEERTLVEMHGADYEDYRRRVPMLIPGVGGRKEADVAALG